MFLLLQLRYLIWWESCLILKIIEQSLIQLQWQDFYFSKKFQAWYLIIFSIWIYIKKSILKTTNMVRNTFSLTAQSIYTTLAFQVTFWISQSANIIKILLSSTCQKWFLNLYQFKISKNLFLLNKSSLQFIQWLKISSIPILIFSFNILAQN